LTLKSCLEYNADMVRKATLKDIRTIHKIIKNFSDKGELLPRALSELYENVRDFNVFEDEKDNSIIGVCALHVCWEDLAEIRSMAVLEPFQKLGVGSQLVDAALMDARELGIRHVFALTYQMEFFGKHGFRVVDKSTLPQKVWADCIRCVKFPDCDETAMLKILDY